MVQTVGEYRGLCKRTKSADKLLQAEGQDSLWKSFKNAACTKSKSLG